VHVVGTAGHVDHGKSSLVRALTGTDPDRWIEEQLRGMTLDLGFAHLTYPDGLEAGIVDVPGHERFLHNMLAGAAGMELVLLVVAANEGPKPQTAEHLAILDYLNVKRAIIVLTKSDLVDAEELALAEELVRDQIAGTVAEGAPAIGVSTITGAGIDALKALIREALVALPPRAPSAPPYLPIDRVFAIPGHGTVVTGTLLQGSIAVGDSLVLQPSGTPVRVRSLQVFGTKRDGVSGGMRVAANVPGVEVGAIARGEVLASDEFVPASSFAVRFRPTEPALAMLRRRSPVRAYIGAAEILGTLVFAAVPTTTDVVDATLHLRHATVAYPGAAFVVRRLSPKDVLGGGTLGGAADAADDLTVEGDADRARVARVLAETKLTALASAQIATAANLREDAVEATLALLVADGVARRIAKPTAYVDGAAANALIAQVETLLAARHEQVPYALGMTSLALSRALGIVEPLLIRLLASAVDDARIAYRSGYYQQLAFVPTLTPAMTALFDGLATIDPAAPYVPTPLDAIVAGMKAAKLDGAQIAFDTLLVTGVFVKVGDQVYRGTQIAEIRGKLEAALRREKEITMAGFRDIVGTSRKYAVPLLEYFDATGVTVRTGDIRRLRIAR
jgi:selenocysteine-specific elongation factor